MILNRKFWIRKDREQYFLSGAIVTCAIAGFVSSYWHFSDRISVQRNFRIQQPRISRTAEFQKLKEVGYFAPKLQVGATRYYRLEEKSALPVIPDLPEENNGN
ncbi:MAG: hypothetical protein A2X28_06820 [Elusimicrobia bacterium GWA2_56_46]|jgi:hypothetical protein|nr:MAG: hypothetical protein A2X28_06820 [Elusimicrobia bacterium GWA2_56_46]OGR54837.1 MAG: hypothetical protein A2X39_11170 [Elusimicrobia bacterium GWC2_56_31]HBB67104.1 hypothetical protein [Elusimicrobiota bacterium]HBW23371.1 hypothetical protein [Elusimicrobiota bacterium]